MALTPLQEQLLASIQQAALGLGKHGKELTALVGELWACKILDLKWEPSEGYDARAKNGRKVQIKTRKSWSTEGVNPAGRLGRFGRKAGYNFTIGLLAELDASFAVVTIRQMSHRKIAELEGKESKGRGLHVRDFQNHSKLIWPRQNH